MVLACTCLTENRQRLDLPEADGWRGETSLVGVDERSIPDKINLMGLDPLSLADKLPSYEQNWREKHHEVIRQKRVGSKIAGLEGGVPVDKDDNDLEAERNPCSIRLEITSIGQGCTVKSLDPARLVEGNVGAAHDDVIDETSCGDDVEEIGENLGGVVGQLQERQEREDHNYGKAIDRNTILGALPQESGCTALDRERV